MGQWAQNCLCPDVVSEPRCVLGEVSWAEGSTIESLSGSPWWYQQNRGVRDMGPRRHKLTTSTLPHGKSDETLVIYIYIVWCRHANSCWVMKFQCVLESSAKSLDGSDLGSSEEEGLLYMLHMFSFFHTSQQERMYIYIYKYICTDIHVYCIYIYIYMLWYIYIHIHTISNSSESFISNRYRKNSPGHRRRASEVHVAARWQDPGHADPGVTALVEPGEVERTRTWP